MPLRLITPSTIKALLLQEVKGHLRLDDMIQEDAVLGSYIQAAHDLWFGEAGMGFVLINEAYEQTFDCWPAVLLLDRAPVSAIESIRYVDGDGVNQILAADQYHLSINRRGRSGVHRAYGVSWPAVRTQREAITVQFTAGFGPSWNDVPEDARLALMQIIAQWYENRMQINVGNIVNDLPVAGKAILQKYQLWSFG